MNHTTKQLCMHTVALALTLVACASYSMDKKVGALSVAHIPEPSLILLKKAITAPPQKIKQIPFAFDTTPFAWHESSGVVACVGTKDTLHMYRPTQNGYKQIIEKHMPDIHKYKTYAFNATGTLFTISCLDQAKYRQPVTPKEYKTYTIDVSTKNIATYTHQTPVPTLYFDAQDRHLLLCDDGLYINGQKKIDAHADTLNEQGPSRKIAVHDNVYFFDYAHKGIQGMQWHDSLTGGTHYQDNDVSIESIQSDGTSLYALHYEKITKINIPSVQPLIMYLLSKNTASVFQNLPFELRQTLARYIRRLCMLSIQTTDLFDSRNLNTTVKVHPYFFTQQWAKDAQRRNDHFDVLDKQGSLLHRLTFEHGTNILGWHGTQVLTHLTNFKSLFIQELVSNDAHTNMRWYAYATTAEKNKALERLVDAELPPSVYKALQNYKNKHTQSRF